MSVAKYKIGQEVQTSDGDRHVVEEIRHRYVVKRVYAKPVPGMTAGLGYLNSYDEEDLSPYVRPLGVGDRVRAGRKTGTVRYIEAGEACWLCDSGGGLSVSIIANLERIPTEANQ